MVAAAFSAVFVVSSMGHRYNALPRSVTRFGLLLGVSFPVGPLIMAAGLVLGLGVAFVSAVAWIGWLALPVWPLVLARLVFNKPPSFNSNQEGFS